MSQHKVGERAFLDTFRGLVPCKVTGIAKILGREEIEIECRVTKSLGAYVKDDVVHFPPSHVIPTCKVVRRGFKLRIKTDFAWVN